MNDDVRIRSLLEEVMNSGRSPKEVCSAAPECLEEVRRRWLRVCGLVSDLEQLLPASGRGWTRGGTDLAGAPHSLPRIPGYELKALIGRGGMGVVYKALHLRLNRTVAVKTLLAAELAPSKELQGLVREAQTVAGLGHPHIVEVFDAGEIEGLPYFTMELVEGGSLAEKLRGVPLPPRDAAVLVERLSAAVQVAHERGVVHRDLKPANILLTADETPKIADFGLARKTTGDSQRTTGSARFGTPSYMAPEQALGTPAAFDPAVDVYALGAILYETLTGRPPFRADSPLETQRQVISEEPVAPSKINRRVPRDIETICLKCLQKNVHARYASAAELNADLGRFLHGEPITARKTGAVVRAVKWSRRHPTASVACGFAALLLVAAIVGGAWKVATSAASRRRVENDLDDAERAQRVSDWTAANAAIVRASLQLGGSGPADLMTRLDTERRNARIVEDLGRVQMVRALGSGSAASFAESDRSYAELFQEACGAGESQAPEESARRIHASPIRTALDAAMYEWILLPSNERRDSWRDAVVEIEDSDHGGWRDRARVAAKNGDRDGVARQLAELRVEEQSSACLLWFAEVIRQFGGDPTSVLLRAQPAHADDFWLNYVLAGALNDRGREREAMRFVQAAIAIRPDAAVGHNVLGNCLRKLHRFEESIAELRESVRLDPAAPASRGNLAMSLAAIGRESEALEHLEIGVKACPDHALYHAHLGIILQSIGRKDESVEHFERAAQLGLDSPAERDALLTGLFDAGHADEAVSTFRTWIERNPASFQEWDGLAEFCLYVGAREEYETTRTRLLETFGSSDDPVVCEKVARACTYAPTDEKELRIATAAIDRALESEKRRPTWRSPYFRLVKAMTEYRAGRPEEAVHLIDRDVSKVLAPVPQLINAMALSDLKRDAEALTSLAWAAAIGDWRQGAQDSREGWMCSALRREAEAKLLKDLDAFTRGKHWPSVPQERLALIATSEDRGMHLATARLYTEAFAMDPALARDLGYECRYRAACAAARYGCDAPGDDPARTPEERAKWRDQALRWMRDDLALLQDGSIRFDRSSFLSKWCRTPDLNGIRDPARIGELPEKERPAFRQLWADVNALLAAQEAN